MEKELSMKKVRWMDGKGVQGMKDYPGRSSQSF
jgi:hypothetical protein